MKNKEHDALLRATDIFGWVSTVSLVAAISVVGISAASILSSAINVEKGKKER